MNLQIIIKLFSYPYPPINCLTYHLKDDKTEREREREREEEEDEEEK